MEGLLLIILTLAVVGFVLWLVITYIPMPIPFQRVIIAVVIIIVLIWLIRHLGLAL